MNILCAKLFIFFICMYIFMVYYAYNMKLNNFVHEINS